MTHNAVLDRRGESRSDHGSSTVADWVHIIRGEFVEIPGLHLTRPQVQRLWGLDPIRCDALLDALVASGFLKRTQKGGFARADSGGQ
jgi:hypothetical protein